MKKEKSERDNLDISELKSFDDFQKIDDFENYIRKELGITPKIYCETGLKKCDLLTGRPIFFRSLEQYLLTDFETKSNLIKWIKLKETENDESCVKRYFYDYLKRYSLIKSLDYFPSHFELRTIKTLLSFKTLLKFFPDKKIYLLIEKLGLKNRFSYFSDLKRVDSLSFDIVCDTREQKPINFGNGQSTVIGKLDFGDYAAKNSEVVIERKSLNDLISTVSSGWTRFNNEMDRVVSSNKYCVILVECDINDFLGFKYMRECRHSKASEDFIFKRCRDLCKSFPNNIQFLFSGGRKNSAKLIPLLLSWDKKICQGLDLQFYKDSKILDKLI